MLAPTKDTRSYSMKYFTDGTNLYELAAKRSVQNFGLDRGMIRYLIIRDCVTEATVAIDELQLATLAEVR